MHETSLAQELLRQAEDLRREHQAERIVRLEVDVGEFSGVDVSALESAFELVAEEQKEEAPVLQARAVPLEARCESCGEHLRLHAFHFSCSKCNSTSLTVLQGEDLILRAVIVE